MPQDKGLYTHDGEEFFATNRRRESRAPLTEPSRDAHSSDVEDGGRTGCCSPVSARPETWRGLLAACYALVGALLLGATLTSNWTVYKMDTVAGLPRRRYWLGMVRSCEQEWDASNTLFVDRCFWHVPNSENELFVTVFGVTVLACILAFLAFFSVFIWCGCDSFKGVFRNMVYPIVLCTLLGVFLFPAGWGEIYVFGFNGGVGLSQGGAYTIPEYWSAGYSYALLVISAAFSVFMVYWTFKEPKWMVAGEDFSMDFFVGDNKGHLSARNATIERDWDEYDHGLGTIGVDDMHAQNAALSLNDHTPRQQWAYDGETAVSSGLSPAPASMAQASQPNSFANRDQPRVLFVVGGPGAGAAQQGALLAAHFGMVHVDARIAVKHITTSSSTLGARLKTYALRAEPLPSVMIVIVLRTAIEESLRRHPDKKDFVITGFPDEKSQAEIFERDVVRSEGMVFLDCPKMQMELRVAKNLSEAGGHVDRVEIREHIDKTLSAFPDLLTYFRLRDHLAVAQIRHEPDETFAQVRTATEQLMTWNGDDMSLAMSQRSRGSSRYGSRSGSRRSRHNVSMSNVNTAASPLVINNTMAAAAAAAAAADDDVASLSSSRASSRVNKTHKLWVPATVRKRAGLGLSPQSPPQASTNSHAARQHQQRLNEQQQQQQQEEMSTHTPPAGMQGTSRLRRSSGSDSNTDDDLYVPSTYQPSSRVAIPGPSDDDDDDDDNNEDDDEGASSVDEEGLTTDNRVYNDDDDTDFIDSTTAANTNANARSSSFLTRSSAHQQHHQTDPLDSDADIPPPPPAPPQPRMPARANSNIQINRKR